MYEIYNFFHISFHRRTIKKSRIEKKEKRKKWRINEVNDIFFTCCSIFMYDDGYKEHMYKQIETQLNDNIKKY